MSTSELSNIVLTAFGLDGVDSLLLQRVKDIVEYIGNPTVFDCMPCPKPMILSIEPTNRCNIDCPFCPGRETDRNGILDVEGFQKLMAEIGPGLKKTNLFLYGEPLLHPRICEIIQIAKDAGALDIRIHTNGLVLTESIARGMVHAGLDLISFSIDGTSQEDYQAYRRGGLVEIALANMKKFAQVRQECGSKKPRILMQSIEFRHLKGKEEGIRETGLAYGADDVVFRKPTGPDIPMNREVFLNYNCSSPLLKMPERCFQPFLHAVVACDGTMRTCCYDLHGYGLKGNVLKSPFESVWNGQLIRQVRKRIIDGHSVKKSCFTCKYRGSAEIIFANYRKGI